MGFGKKSRKEAQQQQVQAMALQQEAYHNAQAQQQAYQASAEVRNAPIRALQGQATNWLNRYEKGEDVAKLNPAFARHAQESANAVQSTLNVAQGLGDTATHSTTKDAGFQAKLNSVASRNIAKGLAGMNMQALEGELQNNRGIVMDTTNFLNSDARAGFGMTSDLFGMTNQIFNSATTRRQMEMQRSNMMMNNLMQGISGGVTGALTAFGVGGFGNAG